eukprot:364058-Chlamydomonas_euryale.AAC.7
MPSAERVLGCVMGGAGGMGVPQAERWACLRPFPRRQSGGLACILSPALPASSPPPCLRPLARLACVPFPALPASPSPACLRPLPRLACVLSPALFASSPPPCLRPLPRLASVFSLGGLCREALSHLFPSLRCSPGASQHAYPPPPPSPLPLGPPPSLAAASLLPLPEPPRRQPARARREHHDAQSWSRRLRATLPHPPTLTTPPGASQHALAEDITTPIMEQMFALNTLGPIKLTRAALPYMLRRGKGRFVVIASMAAKVPSPGQAVYTGVGERVHYG